MEFLEIKNLCKVYGRGKTRLLRSTTFRLPSIEGSLRQSPDLPVPVSLLCFTSLEAWMYQPVEKCIWRGRMCMPEVMRSLLFSEEGRWG